MNQVFLARVFSFAATVIVALGYIRKCAVRQITSLKAVGTQIPTGVLIDVIDFASGAEACKINESQDFGLLLSTQKRVVLFAVPGAFTPTCSAQHLPGFIKLANDIKAKNVDDIYCLSVNDRFVMRSWAEATPDCVKSGIKMVADGNGAYTAALNLIKDATGSRMGLRSKRFAAIIESGKIVALNIDEKGLDSSAAEKILALL